MGFDWPDVSRETRERLDIYKALLCKWNPRINLVAPSTLDEVEMRHFADSFQVLNAAPAGFRVWADFGSGGGFPGLIVALACSDMIAPPRVIMVESDTRKCAFLRTVLRETGVRAEVKSERVEDLDPLNADIASARALAPLSTLLEYFERHVAPDGSAVFLKGERWKEEVQEAESRWKFDLQTTKSCTNTSAKILQISKVSRV